MNASATEDEYHTMDELYAYRMAYHAHSAQGWMLAGVPVVKSWKHSDGELCFGGGWFIVSAQLPTGQVTNHYKAEHWDLFNVPAVDLPPAYDGHTPADALDRLLRSIDYSAKPLATGDERGVSAVAQSEYDHLVSDGFLERYGVLNGWLVEYTNEHNCGTNPGGHYGAHEPGCGLEQIAKIEDLLKARNCGPKLRWRNKGDASWQEGRQCRCGSSWPHLRPTPSVEDVARVIAAAIDEVKADCGDTATWVLAENAATAVIALLGGEG